jgi:hypothetical protein
MLYGCRYYKTYIRDQDEFKVYCNQCWESCHMEVLVISCVIYTKGIYMYTLCN